MSTKTNYEITWVAISCRSVNSSNQWHVRYMIHFLTDFPEKSIKQLSIQFSVMTSVNKIDFLAVFCARAHSCAYLLKSEVAITSLFCQTRRTKNFFITSETITKSPGLLSMSDFEICIKKQNSLVLKLKTWFQRWDSNQISI